MDTQALSCHTVDNLGTVAWLSMDHGLVVATFAGAERMLELLIADTAEDSATGVVIIVADMVLQLVFDGYMSQEYNGGRGSIQFC